MKQSIDNVEMLQLLEKKQKLLLGSRHHIGPYGSSEEVGR